MKKNIFLGQAHLLLDVLPFIVQETCFALKGGTAINFFIRNLPRLSVDIDLAYLPVESRIDTLKNISEALQRIAIRIEQALKGCKIYFKFLKNSSYVIALIAERENARIKIEPNLVFRGTVFPPEKKLLTPGAEEFFQKTSEATLVSFADLYGSKICAALDRQHPRDLFDVKFLLENETITEKIRQAFIVYLLSHNRPIFELLNPHRLDFRRIFELEFQGMTFLPVTYDALVETREQLIKSIQRSLTVKEKRFILSVKGGRPEWHLFPLRQIRILPSIRWKLMNIKKMDPQKREQTTKQLALFFGLDY